MSRPDLATAPLCDDLRGVLDRPLTAAERQLVATNGGLVGWCYDRICRRCVSLSQAHREVLLTCLENRLIRAAQSFDPARGAQFSTYACVCMERTGWQDFVRETQVRFRVRSLDTRCGSNDFDAAHDQTLLAVMPGVEHDLDEPLDYAARLAWMRKVVGERDARLLERRAVDGETLEALGRELGVSKERIRQIVMAAAAKLRRAWGRKVMAKLRKAVAL